MNQDDLPRLAALVEATKDEATKGLARTALHAALRGIASEEARKDAAEQRTVELFDRERLVFSLASIGIVVAFIAVVGLFLAGRLTITEAGAGIGAVVGGPVLARAFGVKIKKDEG